MVGVALDLGRPAHVALDQHAGGEAVRAAAPWRRTAACRGRSARAARRTARSSRPAGWRSRSTPARASEAPISRRNSRRLGGSVHSDGRLGELAVEVVLERRPSPASSSRLRQRTGPSARIGSDDPDQGRGAGRGLVARQVVGSSVAHRAVGQPIDLECDSARPASRPSVELLALREGVQSMSKTSSARPEVALRDRGGSPGTIPWSSARPSRSAASGRPGRGTRRSRPPSGRGCRG